MKKLLLISALTLVLPSMAYAKCDGGTELEGKNKHVYCVSNQDMNWWSAFAWCKANERPLVTLDQACNNQNWSGGCTNMQIGINNRGWSAIASGDSNAYLLPFTYGNVVPRPRTVGARALCY